MWEADGGRIIEEELLLWWLLLLPVSSSDCCCCAFATMRFNLLVLPGGLLAKWLWDGVASRLRMPAALVVMEEDGYKAAAVGGGAAPALEEAAFEEEADDLNAFSARCRRQRKEPGWLVGEHRQTILTAGGDDGWCEDFFAITLAEGFGKSGDEILRFPLVETTSFCWGVVVVVVRDCPLPEDVVEERLRGFRTALRRFEACILANLFSEREKKENKKNVGISIRRSDGRKEIHPTTTTTSSEVRVLQSFFFAKTTRGHTRRCGSRVGKLPERQRNLDSGQEIAQSAKCSNCVGTTRRIWGIPNSSPRHKNAKKNLTKTEAKWEIRKRSVKNPVECFIWVQAQIYVASESRLKETEEEEERQGKSMQTAENKKRSGEREKRRRTRARERTEKKETTSKRERRGRCCPFYNLLLGCLGTGPGNTGRRMEYYVHDPTRPDPTRPGQFSAALHNRTVPTFQKTGIMTTVGLKESGGKSDGWEDDPFQGDLSQSGGYWGQGEWSGPLETDAIERGRGNKTPYPRPSPPNLIIVVFCIFF